MVSLNTALKLKKAGLEWQPALHDFFAIPDRQMDETVFVLSDMLVTTDEILGIRVVSFQGASEWALDSLVTDETVWLPREDQLRRVLEEILLASGHPEILLKSGLEGCSCAIHWHGARYVFIAQDASEAYAAALLHVLQINENEV